MKIYLLLLAALFAFACVQGDYPLSDEEYIAIAGETEEAQAFLEKYPGATVSVERSGSLGVAYTLEDADNLLRLKVGIDPSNNEVDKFIVQCYEGGAVTPSLILMSDVTTYIQNSELGRC